MITKRRLLFLITIILIMLFLMCGYSISKFNSRIVKASNSEIAKPILILTEGESITIDTTVNREKTSDTYEFQVRNYDNEDINQVELEYCIEIITETAGLSFELLKDGTTIILNNSRTNYIKMQSSEKVIHNYNLEIKHDETTNIINDVQIKIYAKQSV